MMVLATHVFICFCGTHRHVGVNDLLTFGTILAIIIILKILYLNRMKEIENIGWFLIHRCHNLITLFLLYKRNAITLFTAKQTSCQSHKKDISAVLSLFRPPSCNSALNHFQHVNVHLLWSDEIRSIKEIMSHILLIGNVQFGKSALMLLLNCVSNDRMYRIQRVLSH